MDGWMDGRASPVFMQRDPRGRVLVLGRLIVIEKPGPAVEFAVFLGFKSPQSTKFSIIFALVAAGTSGSLAMWYATGSKSSANTRLFAAKENPFSFSSVVYASK